MAKQAAKDSMSAIIAQTEDLFKRPLPETPITVVFDAYGDVYATQPVRLILLEPYPLDNTARPIVMDITSKPFEELRSMSGQAVVRERLFGRHKGRRR